MTTDVTGTREARAGQTCPDARAAERDDTTAPASRASGAVRDGFPASSPTFFRRHRLPLLLAVVAACLYAGSILYILYGRGQVA